MSDLVVNPEDPVFSLCDSIFLLFQSDHLSLEKLLMQTIEVRTHVKLKELGMSMQRYVDGKCKYELLSV